MTGFVESQRVEIVRQNPPEEPKRPEESQTSILAEQESAPEELESQDVGPESEELKNLLEEMENEIQEVKAQEESPQELKEIKLEEAITRLPLLSIAKRLSES